MSESAFGMAQALLSLVTRLVGALLLIGQAVFWAATGRAEPTLLCAAATLTGVGSAMSTIDEINAAVKQLVFGVCAGAGTSRYKENP